MLMIDKYAVFIPETKLSILSLSKETALPKSMLSVFKLIYGLESIPVWKSDTQSLIKKSLDQLFLPDYMNNQIQYIIYVHTASWISFMDNRIDSFLQRYFSAASATIFESTLYKCVGFFKALELFSQILEPRKCAIIITGEAAFTPKLRVVPRSTIAGDASTVTVFTKNGSTHTLLAIYTRLIPDYEKGIYLTESELKSFESCYIDQTVSVIEHVLSAAHITLSQIKWILPHNVNRPTWVKIANALSFSIEKIYLKNIAALGHCFCSDHVINLHSVISEGLLNAGDYYLMVGCGLGFFISAAVWQF